MNRKKRALILAQSAFLSTSYLLKSSLIIHQSTCFPPELGAEIRVSNGDEILNALAHGSLAEIAAAANVSSNTCLNCFRQVLDISPMEFLTTYRLEQARHLLLTTDWPAAQVGERCGFLDPSYFGKLFRQKMGKTPGQCRRGMHGEND